MIIWEDNNCSSQWGIPLGDMFVEGIDSHCNLSIKANDFVVSENLQKFYIMPNLLGFLDGRKNKNTLKSISNKQ